MSDNIHSWSSNLWVVLTLLVSTHTPCSKHRFIRLEDICVLTNMWQSKVELNIISLRFHCFTEFEALLCKTSVKGGAHEASQDYPYINAGHMSPTLNRSLALQHFEHDKYVME